MKPPTPFTVEKSETPRSREVLYSVHGFLSNDYVRVTQKRHYRTGVWADPEVRWSAGGRDREMEPDNAVAAKCFALAIQDAVEVARELRKESPNPTTP